MDEFVVLEKETMDQSGAPRTDSLDGMVVATPGKGGGGEEAAWSTPDNGAVAGNKQGLHLADTNGEACNVARGNTNPSDPHVTEEASHHHDVGGYDGNRGCESVPADHRALYFLREAEASITWLRQENDYLRKEKGNDEFILRRLQDQVEAVMEKERLVDEEIKRLAQRIGAERAISENLKGQMKESESKLQAERKRVEEQSEEIERLHAKCIDEALCAKNRGMELGLALKEKAELVDRLELSDEKCRETAEQLERLKQAVREKEAALASLQDKHDEGSNEALNQINMLKEREKSLSEANQVLAETMCDMEMEKKKIQDNLEESNNSNIKLTESLEEAQQARRNLEETYRNQEIELRDLLDQQRKDIECMKSQASESDAKVSFLLSQIQDKDARVRAKEDQVGQGKTELERALRNLEVLKEEHKEHSSQLRSNFEKELEAVQGMHGQITQLLNAKVSTLEETTGELRAQIEKSLEENAAIKRRNSEQVDQYKAANQELEKSLHELKDVEIKYLSTKEALDTAEADRGALKQQVETLQKTLLEMTALQERSQRTRVERESDGLHQPSKASKDITTSNPSVQRRICRRLKATSSMMRDSKDPNPFCKKSLNRNSKLFSMFENQNTE